MKISVLRNKADQLWQEKCLSLCKWCLVCGNPAQVSHHYVPKSVSSTLRYYIPNGIQLCYGCHYRLHASGDPRFNNTIVEKKGDVWLLDIEKERKKTVKMGVKYYQGIIEKLSTG